MNLTVFWHCAALPGWQEIAEEQAEILAKCPSVMAIVLGTEAASRELIDIATRNGVPLGLTWLSGDLQQYEAPTLIKLWHHARQFPDDASAYLHFKGVTHPESDARQVQRRRMQDAIFGDWQANIQRLDEYDALGASFESTGGHHYFPGNFWMAANRWVKNLDRPLEWNREAAEWWIGSKRGFRPLDLSRIALFNTTR